LQLGLAQFSRDIGHISQEIFCVRGAGNTAVVGGRTVRIRTVRTTRRKGTIFKAGCWHEFRGKSEVFFAAEGISVLSVQQTVGTIF
jgi:hypothetical protein